MRNIALGTLSDCCKSGKDDCGCDDGKKINITINNSADSGYRESNNPYSQTNGTYKSAVNVPQGVAQDLVNRQAMQTPTPIVQRQQRRTPATAARTAACKVFTITPEWG